MGFVMDTDSTKGRLPEPITKLDENTLDKLAINKTVGYTANLSILQNSAFSGGFFNNPLLDDDGVFRYLYYRHIKMNCMNHSLLH